jgi:hypothetical protein
MTAVLTYEEKLSRFGMDWALWEASMHFEEKSAVHQIMRRIAQRLTQLGILYAVGGGMALFLHGFRRFTEGVDILVTAEGLAEIHRQLDGLGYVRPFANSKHLRDTETGVRVEFLVAGQYPGDGKPKPVAFPDPAEVAEEQGGVQRLRLSTLAESKLASGMNNPGRLKDLGDVQEVIRVLHLPAEFADQLNSFVRDQYLVLWHGVHDSPPEP